jgi:hypothetical protein
LRLGLTFLPGAASDQDLPTYAFLHSWNYRNEPPCLACLLRRVFAKFLPGLASNHNVPDLCLLNKLGWLQAWSIEPSHTLTIF